MYLPRSISAILECPVQSLPKSHNNSLNLVQYSFVAPDNPQWETWSITKRHLAAGPPAVSERVSHCMYTAYGVMCQFNGLMVNTRYHVFHSTSVAHYYMYQYVQIRADQVIIREVTLHEVYVSVRNNLLCVISKVWKSYIGQTQC